MVTPAPAPLRARIIPHGSGGVWTTTLGRPSSRQKVHTAQPAFFQYLHGSIEADVVFSTPCAVLRECGAFGALQSVLAAGV